MNQTKKTVPLTFLDILIVILFLLFVYFVLTRIFGHSATDLSIMMSLFSVLGTFLAKGAYEVYKLNREFGEFKVKTIISFEKMHADMEKIKNKLKVT